MSGGSYDYFYTRAPESLQRIASDLHCMAAQCTDPTGWGREGVDTNELAAVGAYLGALALKVDGIALAVGKLERVTHDIEWWRSGDSGPEHIVKSFKDAQPSSQEQAEPNGSADT
jgi:hypothetical protein